jgi:hypothetical protein
MNPVQLVQGVDFVYDHRFARVEMRPFRYTWRYTPDNLRSGSVVFCRTQEIFEVLLAQLNARDGCCGWIYSED